jgi:hypothetical protein
VSNKIISINRGDSYEFTVFIPEKADASKAYKLKENQDVVYFAVMCPHQPFEKSRLVKGYTVEEQNDKGEITIVIEPNDTRRLLPGIYYYTVKLQRGGTLDIIDDFDDALEVRTIIERTKFIVNE